MTSDFDNYIKDGSYEAYVLPSFDKQICNCHMLQKKDAGSLQSADNTVNEFLSR